MTLWPPHHCWPNYNLWFLILLKPPTSISMSLYVCTTCERLEVGSCQIKLDFLCPKRALSVDHLTIILLPKYPIYIYIYSIYILLQLLIPHFEIFLASKYPLAINHGNWKSPYRLLFRLDNHRLQMVDVRLPCLITRGHPPYSIRNILDLVQSWAICLYSAGSHVRMITL